MDQTTFEFLRYLIDSSKEGNVEATNLLIGIFGNSNRLINSNRIIFELMSSHDMLLKFHKANILGDFSYYPMPEFRDKPFHCDAYIHNNYTGIKGEAVSIQFKNRNSYKIAQAMGFTIKFNKIGYYNLFELTTHLDEIKTAIDFNKIHMKTYNYLVRVNRFRTLENTSKLFVNIVNNLIK